jgi:outer membrane protein OmpA-like peptidoglycan-associated protein
LRAWALTVFVLAIAACATPHKPVPVVLPPAKPVHIVPAPHPHPPVPTRTPAVTPASAAPPIPVTAPISDITVLDSSSYEKDKIHVKQALATDDRDALAPADVGYYMDVLHGRLTQAVAGSGIGIGHQGVHIVLDLSNRAAFAPGNAQIGSGIHQILKSISKVLVEYRLTLISVRVRADTAGGHAINPGLAQQRALMIAHDLVEDGVAVKRIVTAVAGSASRVRVELQLEPIVRADSGH